MAHTGTNSRSDQYLVSKPFIIGLFLGAFKPSSANEYLEDFINEMKEILRDGVSFSLDRTLTVSIINFVCDTPARSFVKCVKGHSGYSGCDKCTEPGLYTERRMTFPSLDANTRTDQSFEAQVDEEHHRETSCLQQLGVGMVSQFPLDYMHLICLGVTRKLLSTWMHGPLAVRLGPRVVLAISDLIVLCKAFVPREFARKGRALAEVDRWKATEFRTFLLYTGAVTLKGNLPEPYYSHFIVLVVAMTLLISPSRCSDYNDYAKRLLAIFVAQCGELHGEQFLIYNIHASSHLADEVRKFGCVDKFSAFPYENYLNILKRMLRKSQQPLQQVIRRFAEKNACAKSTLQPGRHASSTFSWKYKHFSGPLPEDASPRTKQYKELHCKNYAILTNQRDSSVSVGEDIFQVKNILVDGTEPTIVCWKFSRSASFFEYPVDSREIGIYIFGEFSNRRLYHFPATAIVSKVVLLPFKDGYVAFPLNHIS